MNITHERPLPHESIHLRRAQFGGALCRATVYPAPWVTKDVALVTCAKCRARLDKPVLPAVARAVPVFDDPPSAVRPTPASTSNRVHAAARRTGVDGLSPLCGARSTLGGLLMSAEPREVTCWNCKLALRNRGQKAVARG